MAHYIFIRSSQPNARWELLEKVERSEVAHEAFRNYRQRFASSAEEEVAMIEAVNLLEGRALLDESNGKDLHRRFTGLHQLPWRNDASS